MNQSFFSYPFRLNSYNGLQVHMHIANMTDLSVGASQLEVPFVILILYI